MVALRIGASDIRPDGQVREQTDQRFIGDDVYNDTGADQTRRLTASPGQSRTFHVATCTDNDGQPSRRRFPGRFRLHANPATDGSRVRFLRTDVDVTPVIRSTQGLKLKVPVDGCARVVVRIRIRPTAEVGSKQSAVITSTWDEELLTHSPCQGRSQGRACQVRTVTWSVRLWIAAGASAGRHGVRTDLPRSDRSCR